MTGDRSRAAQLTAGPVTHGRQDSAATWRCPCNPRFWALCKAEGEHDCRAGAPKSFPVLCHRVPAAHRSTPASRRRFSWCPVHPQSWRAQSHLGGHAEGRGTAGNPSGASKWLPGPPGRAGGVPPGWERLGLQHQQRLPGKPTDFQGSVGGKVCVEQVLWLQVTVDDSVFMQILRREKAGMQKGRGGGRWTLGRWPMDLGEVAGARRTRYRGTAPHDTIAVFGTPPSSCRNVRRALQRGRGRTFSLPTFHF